MLAELTFVALAVVVLAAGAALTIGWTVLRRRYVDEIADRAASFERARLAEDLHDLIGHDLALIAVQAGALEVGGNGGAAQIRAAAHRATLSLREVTDVLGASDARLDVAGAGVQEVVAAARAAGMEVEARIADLTGATLPVQLTVAGLVREALTNAARHAPGAPVSVTVAADDRVRAELSNPAAAAPRRPGSGLASLRRRVELLGGSFEATQEAGVFTVRAELPTAPRVRATTEPRHPPSPTVQLARRAWPAATAATVVVLAFYTWATYGATLEPGPRRLLSVGQPEAQAGALLPRRQAPVRLYAAPAVPAAWSCRSYTEGNFPLGLATVRVCFDEGKVVAVQDLTVNAR
ncbi:sensor histidine kinase [Spongisporangium articulatum]|uniref:histidine kinase n=1 Tax=Spongisporangium articulatum TaxID=3362603 RepID=A0ABW8AIV4_9ACTN